MSSLARLGVITPSPDPKTEDWGWGFANLLCYPLSEDTVLTRKIGC